MTTSPTTTVTPSYLERLTELTPAQVEDALFTRLQHLDATERYSYAEKGRMCLYVETERLHALRTDPESNQPCSFDRWLRIAAPFGYSTARQAMRDMQDLADVPATDLADIPQSNFGTLKQLSSAVRADPKVIEAAKTQRSEAFVATIRKEHPSQHLEASKPFRCILDESASAKVEAAIEKAMERGAANRGEALEYLAEEAMTSWQSEEQMEREMADNEVTR